MKLLVCGGRDFTDNAYAYNEILRLSPSAIIQGKAKGADQIGGLYATEFGLPNIEVGANWDFYNKAAGPIRNGWMLKYCNPDAVLALPGGRGTQHMIDLAKKAGLPVYEHRSP